MHLDRFPVAHTPKYSYLEQTARGPGDASHHTWQRQRKCDASERKGDCTWIRRIMVNITVSNQDPVVHIVIDFDGEI